MWLSFEHCSTLISNVVYLWCITWFYDAHVVCYWIDLISTYILVMIYTCTSMHIVHEIILDVEFEVKSRTLAKPSHA